MRLFNIVEVLEPLFRAVSVEIVVAGPESSKLDVENKRFVLFVLTRLLEKCEEIEERLQSALFVLLDSHYECVEYGEEVWHQCVLLRRLDCEGPVTEDL